MVLLNTELPLGRPELLLTEGPWPRRRPAGLGPTWLGLEPLLTLASVCFQNSVICCRKHHRLWGESLVLHFSLSLLLCPLSKPLPSLQFPSPSLGKKAAVPVLTVEESLMGLSG